MPKALKSNHSNFMEDYTSMPPHSRVWVYQANRELSAQEIDTIDSLADAFLDRWTSHGAIMNARIDIFYNRFIVVFVDERTAPATGCGIDKSVNFMKELEEQYNISLLNRLNVAFRKEDKIYACALTDFGKLLNERLVDENTIVFNNLVATKEEFDTRWEIPLKESWHFEKFKV